MRHPHGLRAAAGNQGIVLPSIGDAFEGGFFAGTISHTADGVATHALIVAPAASGYNGKSTLQWKTSDTSTSGTSSVYDGAANTANMDNASHPAAQYCAGLTIDGYSDWYMPARYELDIAYHNLKPSTTSNDTSFGINDYSVPKRTSNRTAGNPAQTSVAAFQSGGAEAFETGGAGGVGIHYSSTEFDSTLAWFRIFASGDENGTTKTNSRYVRAFRRIAL